MQTTIKWQKSIFSSQYQLFSNHQDVGYLSHNMSSLIAKSNFKNNNFSFITNGFWSRETKMFDVESDTEIGNIIYYDSLTKAAISFQGDSYTFQYTDKMRDNWQVTNESGIKIAYSGSFRKGSIEGNTSERLLLIVGLFIANLFWQKTIIAIFAILIVVQLFYFFW